MYWLAILLFIPAFGDGQASSETVSLFGLTGINFWVKTIFIVIIAITIINVNGGIVTDEVEECTDSG